MGSSVKGGTLYTMFKNNIITPYHYEKDEPLKINIIINTIIIFEKLHIAKILLQLLHKVYYKDKT